MSRVQITVEEAVDTLKRSSIPSVITEGLDDYIVFRRFEERFSDLGLSLMPLGGRDQVLSVFRRRTEFRQIKTAFIVDRDMWLFSGVPDEFDSPDIAVTDGYSIENDMYRDGNLYDLMDARERNQFDRDVSTLSRWFAREVEIFLSNKSHQIDMHVDRIVDHVGQIIEHVAIDREHHNLDEQFAAAIEADYSRLIRGKTLMSLLSRYLSYNGRLVRHNHRNLMEIASIAGGPCMGALAEKIEAAFRP